ncbi:type II toxin-antitoxin system HicB family antitoxin [Okeania sp.]|uniref:type II toxin-antitoxin system HicB family antitoxin n=1 Tax=Okeania sp. TaxID=3100323 RepID=UPI002B4B223B|nr:type II toxin-antitoxin system HicB family antitoxin [Okeania sp.]MEB3341264.1 type II toxin-antitoxin system HicB family antitoxin [Okeania sp.]
MKTAIIAIIKIRKTLDFLQYKNIMEKLLQLEIEKLPEGVYLATSDALPGLVAQGESLTETLEIARDVANKLIEARRERQQ